MADEISQSILDLPNSQATRLPWRAACEISRTKTSVWLGADAVIASAVAVGLNVGSQIGKIAPGKD
jgi:hypothetical protein